jgi:SAM-dependent methyltransferase
MLCNVPERTVSSRPGPQRLSEVTSFLAEVLTPRAPLTVIVDGGDHGAAATFAARLAEAFPPSARAWTVDAVLGLSGPSAARVDSALNVLEPAADRVIVYLRSGPRGPLRNGEGERRAQVVIDHHDPQWPVIRHVHPRLADPESWYLTESRAFFEVRAAGWDKRFGDDLPAYAMAIDAGAPRPGDLALDVGCGTGRALPALAAAVGPGGRVLGLDLTPAMLAEARAKVSDGCATLILADCRRLPVPDAAAGVVFAAGLLTHLPDPATGLAELARVTRVGGRLVLFHPTGRAALAARHGRTLRPDEPLNEDNLAPLLVAAGWELTRYEDPADHFLAVAVKKG